MKKFAIIISILFFTLSLPAYSAQGKKGDGQGIFTIGLKAGANATLPHTPITVYSPEGSPNPISNSIAQAAYIGGTAGLFARVKIPVIGLFIEAEALYTNASTKVSGLAIDFLEPDKKYDYSLHRLDVPVHLGISFLKLIQVYGGASFNYVFDHSIKSFNDVKAINFDKRFSTAWNVGARVTIKKFAIDARYQFGNKENSIDFENSFSETFNIYTNPSTFTLGLAYSFF